MALPRDSSKHLEEDRSTDVFKFTGGNAEQKANAVLGSLGFDDVRRIRIEVTTVEPAPALPGGDLVDAHLKADQNATDESPTLEPGTQVYAAVMAVVEADAKRLDCYDVADAKDCWTHRDDPAHAAAQSLSRAHDRGFLNQHGHHQPAEYSVSDQYRRVLVAEADEEAIL